MGSRQREVRDGAEGAVNGKTLKDMKPGNLAPDFLQVWWEGVNNDIIGRIFQESRC